MADPFSISRSLSSVLPDAELADLIIAQTGSVGEADAIVRSIRRFGDDESILHYDMTPTKGRGTRHNPRAASWSVRAVRP
ncbi:MAG: hypothetical protein HKN73_17805 [Gemmatimonadetes bacterium]|nr:hypothetical protein [Gemmatimonadota bacterium]